VTGAPFDRADQFGEVDIDLLADYVGGALMGTPEESAVAARIADDPVWQSAYASLADGMSFVSAELGRLSPEPMPADLAARLNSLFTTPATDLTASTNAGRTSELSTSAPTSPATEHTAPADPLLNGAAIGPSATADSPAGSAAAPDAADWLPAGATVDADAAADSLLAGAAADLGEPADSFLSDSAADTASASDHRDRHEAPENQAPENQAPENQAVENQAAENETAGGQGAEDENVSAVPTAADLAAPPKPHLTLVRGGLADGGGARGGGARGGDGAGRDGAHGVRKTRPAPRRGRRLRWAAPIAVAAGLVAFVGFGLDYLAGRSTSHESTDSGAGVSAAGNKAPRVAEAEPTLSSGIDYTHATLGIAAMQPMTAPLTSQGPGRKTAPEFASGVEPALQRLAAPATLAECLAAIEEANAAGALTVESVDYARFDGAPAVIVRFTAANGQWAWASGADCGTQASGAATLDKVPVG
jgi:hypothetical protein